MTILSIWQCPGMVIHSSIPIFMGSDYTSHSGSPLGKTYGFILCGRLFDRRASNTVAGLKGDFLEEGPFRLGFERCLGVH